jgi:hypothetical protein
VLTELVLLTGVVVAVAVLTQLRPGSVASAARAQAPIVVAPPAKLPPGDGVVEAHELDKLAVAIARTPGRAVVTVLGSDGNAATGESVTIGGVRATSCGPGCYAAAARRGPLRVAVGSQRVTFTTPERAPSGTSLLRRVTAAYRASRTIVFDEQLASSPSDATVTRFTVVAPDRLAFVTKDGPQGIVVALRRWDRDGAGKPWEESPQARIAATTPYWSAPTNVHEIRPGVLTFLDRRVPAWFTLALRGSRPHVLRMTAAAHFMVDRYAGFDVPAEVSPPASR